MKTTKPTAAQMRAAYLFVFDCFSADTKEVAKHLEVTTAEANAILDAIPGNIMCASMIEVREGCLTDYSAAARKQYPGKPIIWQCWTTYDSEERAAAEARIDAALGLTPPAATTRTTEADRAAADARIDAALGRTRTPYLTRMLVDASGMMQCLEWTGQQFQFISFTANPGPKGYTVEQYAKAKGLALVDFAHVAAHVAANQ